jgi:hypothetical protein
MSSFNEKVAAVTAVLKDNARQRRVTNRQELAQAAAARLFAKGQKKTSDPLDRYKLIDVLDKVAKLSGPTNLTALVVHFQDSKPGRRFAEWAPGKNHQDEVRAVFAAYGDAYSAGFYSSTPAHAAVEDVDDDYEDYDDDTDEGD